MKSTFEKKAAEAVFKIALNAEEWEKEIESAYQRTKKRYKIPGFRPGHAPRRFIEMHYGQGVFFDAAVDACINNAYAEQMAAHPELETFGQPDVAFDKPEEGDAFAFTLTVTLYPEVKLGEYKGIKLPKIEYNVSDDDVQARIDADLHHASRLEKTDRAAKSGDVTLIDYVGTVDGVEFEGGKASDYELKLGSNTFIPGFEDGLIGIKAGEERDVNVKFPDEYHAEALKGKPAVFHVTCKEVREELLPALDDEFVKDRTKYETVDEYKTGLRADLETAAKQRERSERIDAAMKAIADNAECEVPEKIVAAEVERMFREMAHNLSHYGISVDDYLKYNNSSPEQFRSERKGQAETNVKMRQVMKAIIAAEKIEVTEADIDKKFEDDTARHTYEHEAEHHGGDAREFAKSDILTDKFFDFILENNEFTLEEGEAEKPAKKSAAKKSETAATADKKPAAKKPAAKKPATKKTEE
ncbi:MAG: trigger factor [Clostridiales bacterium]|nr:trigger factor [Clostridiales bacterium]